MRLRVASLALLLAACIEPQPPPSPPVGCRATGTGGSLDTLEVVVTLDPLQEGRRGTVLVRVDPLAEGFVTFNPPDPNGSAAALAVTPAGRFVGCVAFGVAEFRLTTPAVLARHAWLRVTTDRVVRVRVESPDSLRLSVEDGGIQAGASGTIAWQQGEAGS